MKIEKAIWQNRRKVKYRKLISKIRLQYFTYVDAGKEFKYQRIIKQIERIIK